MGEKIQNAKDVVLETIDDYGPTIATALGCLVSIAVSVPIAIWGYKKIGQLQAKGFVSECRKSGLF